MPELPEVETTVNELKPHIVGKKIVKVDVFTGNSIAVPSVEEFKKGLAGNRIIDVNRRGKHLVFLLDSGRYLIVHLRMTGALILKSESEEPEKYVRVLLHLDNKTAVHFRDVRRFGRMWLVDNLDCIVGKLGCEPLDEGFTSEALAEILKNRKTPVKSLLLNQTLIAGIGNMYADEALFQAGIHPLRQAGSLKKSEIKKLQSAIQSVLHKGIRNKGASTATFIRPGGIKGSAQLEFQVAHRKGEKCPSCGGIIERIVVGQRSTFFCPECQN